MPDNPPTAKNRPPFPGGTDPRVTNRWKETSKAYRAENPICQRCQSLGMVDIGSTRNLEVHHIRGLETALSEVELWEICFDWNNLLTVCNPCHRRYDQMERYGMRDEAEIEAKEIKDDKA